MKFKEPKNIFIEFPRGNGNKGEINKTRFKTLKDKIDSELKSELNDKKGELFKEKIYLYFLQNGHDLYDGKSINLNFISDYEVDHIIPRSFPAYEDSLSNKVLTSYSNNMKKGNHVPKLEIINKQEKIWEKLKKEGLLSQKKFDRLTTAKRKGNPNGYDYNAGFVARQLTSTRQVTKYVGNILGNIYKDTNIVSVNANLNSYLRERGKFPKNRDINDFHHAFDAYLTSFVGMAAKQKLGNHLFKNFMVLNSDYQKFSDDDKQKIKKIQDTSILNDYFIGKKNGERDYVRNVYETKQIPINTKCQWNHGALFDQTIYGRKEAKANVNIKRNRGKDLYGGYGSEKNSFMVLVKDDNDKKTPYYLEGFKTLDLNEIKGLHGKKLKEKVQDIVNKRNSRSDLNVKMPKVLFNQLIFDKNEYGRKLLFRCKTVDNVVSPSQIYLPTCMVKALNFLDIKNKNIYDDIYEYIKRSIKEFSPFLEQNFGKKLGDGSEKFKELTANQKRKDLILILDGLRGKIPLSKEDKEAVKNIGLNEEFGRVKRKIKLSSQAKLIFQSPTGLFSHSVNVKDL